MTERRTGNFCVHFSFLPKGMKILYTWTIVVLGLGYLFAMIHIFSSHAGRDGDPMLSVNDLIIAYSGSASDTRLESALKGPMANMLPGGEREEIVAWVRRGASSDDYSSISGILENRCISCHDGHNPHIPDLSNVEGVQKLAEADTGMDLFTLVRVSHIHLFGITFIFFILSSIFCHTYFKRGWMKCLLISLPFIMIIFDIGSWYLTKIIPGFAYVVMGSGFLMGISFATQALVSLYQIWFYKLPVDFDDDPEKVA